MQRGIVNFFCSKKGRSWGWVFRGSSKVSLRGIGFWGRAWGGGFLEAGPGRVNSKRRDVLKGGGEKGPSLFISDI